MKRTFLPLLLITVLVFTTVLNVSLPVFAEANQMSADSSGALQINDVRENFSIYLPGSSDFYPNIIYKTKLTGQYSVTANLYKLNNGSTDYLISLGLDSKIGGQDVFSKAVGFFTDGGRVFTLDGAVVTKIYNVDATGNKLNTNPSGNFVMQTLGVWTDGRDVMYKFEVRTDGTIGIYYDLPTAQAPCTTLRNIAVIENASGSNINTDFSYTDGYFAVTPNTDKGMTGGVAGYDPMNLKINSVAFKLGNQPEQVVKFSNMNDNWLILTDGPSFNISVTGGTPNATTAKTGQTVTFTPDAPPDGKMFDHWVVNGSAIDGHQYTMTDENINVEAVFVERAPNQMTADSSGALQINDVQENFSIYLPGSSDFYPNIIYKTKLTGQYSVTANLYKLNNGSTDYLISLGLDSIKIGGQDVFNKAVGFFTDGGRVFTLDGAVVTKIYNVDATGNKLNTNPSGNFVMQTMGVWTDGRDVMYKFEVRTDGTIGIYYDLPTAQAPCTTLRNIAVIENASGSNINTDFSYTDGYFAVTPNTDKGMTGGVAGYDPMNLKINCVTFKLGNQPEQVVKFSNMNDNWLILTDGPSFNISVTGGTSNATTIKSGQTVTFTPDAPPDGKMFDHWVVNGSAIDGHQYTITDEDINVEAVYSDWISNKTSVDASGALLINNVQENASLVPSIPIPYYYPNIIYKQKLAGQYSVTVNLFKHGNGGFDYILSLGLDSDKIGGYLVNKDAIGFFTNAGFLEGSYDLPSDSKVFTKIYEVDTNGDRLFTRPSGHYAMQALGDWLENRDVLYRFEVRMDGTIGIYYDFANTPNPCTTLRNIAVIEDASGNNVNTDFCYTDGYFAITPNNQKEMTKGASGYDPLNLRINSATVISDNQAEKTVNFQNLSDNWIILTDSPAYHVYMTGGTVDVTEPRYDQVVVFTTDAPDGKILDHWVVNGEAITTNHYIVESQDLYVTAVYVDASSDNNQNPDTGSANPLTMLPVILAIPVFSFFIRKKNKNGKRV